MDFNGHKRKEDDDKICNIIFEKKNTRANIRMGINLGIILVIALIIVGMFLNFFIKHKYGDIIEEVKSKKLNNDNMIISNYTSIVKEVSDSLVIINSNDQDINSVTGVVITTDGVILTNYSGIKDMTSLNITLEIDKKPTLEGKLILKNDEFDLAVIKVDYEEELIPIKLGNSDNTMEGQEIAILGNVYVNEEKIDSVVPGIITTKYTSKVTSDSLGEECSLIQISAPVNSNNTGGPICNANGELIGIASLYLTEKYKSEGLYYGIQIKKLDSIINSTIIVKEVLGITDGGILIDSDKEQHGFYVGQLKKDGNAYKAGIRPTDIILSINGIDLISSDEIPKILDLKNAEDTLNCKVLSNGQVKNIEVKISS